METASVKPTLLRSIYFGMNKTIHNIKKRKFALLLFTIPFFVFTNLPLLIEITVHANIEFSILSRSETFTKAVLIILFLLISLVTLPGMFTIHFYYNENLNFMEAVEHSKDLLKTRYVKTILQYLVFNALLTLGFFLFYYGLLLVTAVVVYLFSHKTLAVSVFLSIYPRINFYTTLIFSMVTFILNLNFVASLFHMYQEENFSNFFDNFALKDYAVTNERRHNKLFVTIILNMIIVAGIINFSLLIYNDTFGLGDALSGIQISSHRGNSHVAPENTIPALENAILADSDYAEIDIRQTKDGVLVLLHDNNLLRTAGVNRYIWELTKAELDEMDVGSWFGIEYMNTHIPTLEEVLIHCKGRIKLNIEIKLNNKTNQLEEQLVQLIEDYDYINQCIVSSSNYKALTKVKQLNDKIKTGYILSAAYGNFYSQDYIDFFSIKSSFVTKNVVEQAHSLGKEIHVWTVNSTKEIERMKSIGVDCVITDNPTLAREIIYRDDTNQGFIQLIRRMFKNRSLYRLSQIINN
jgi:glycerophosphoryl diester phosphodiesterase